MDPVVGDCCVTSPDVPVDSDTVDSDTPCVIVCFVVASLTEFIVSLDEFSSWPNSDVSWLAVCERVVPDIDVLPED